MCVETEFAFNMKAEDAELLSILRLESSSMYNAQRNLLTPEKETRNLISTEEREYKG